MKRLFKSRFLFILSLIFLNACRSNPELNRDKNLIDFEGIEVYFDDSWQILVPKYFQEMVDINPKATVQWGFINEEKDSSKAGFEDEIYLTVITLPTVELEPTFADTGRITLNKVNNRTAVNLDLILEDFEIINSQPKPVLINGIAAIKNEFKGRLGAYKVYYKMAIYETETDFYQLLIWCMQKHSDKHKTEMEGIIQSFESA